MPSVFVLRCENFLVTDQKKLEVVVTGKPTITNKTGSQLSVTTATVVGDDTVLTYAGPGANVLGTGEKTSAGAKVAANSVGLGPVNWQTAAGASTPIGYHLLLGCESPMLSSDGKLFSLNWRVSNTGTGNAATPKYVIENLEFFFYEDNTGGLLGAGGHSKLRRILEAIHDPTGFADSVSFLSGSGSFAFGTGDLAGSLLLGPKSDVVFALTYQVQHAGWKVYPIITGIAADQGAAEPKKVRFAQLFGQ